MSNRKKWVVLGAALVVAGLGYGFSSLFLHTGGDFITVSEANSQVGSLYNQPMAVRGRVDPSSIKWDAQDQVMKFALIDNGGRLDVVYRGVVPDHFKPGADLAVEGRYTRDGGLEALSFPTTRSLCSICH